MDALITIRSGRTFQQREIQCPECRTIFKRSDAKPNVSLSRMLVDHHRRHHPTALASAPLPAPASVEDTLPIGGPPPPRLSDAYALELMELGATPALLSTLVDREAAVGVRMFLLDNSGSTDTWDGSTLRLTSSSATTPEGERQGAKYTLDSATRWDEIKQVARDHARHNLELNHVCEFHLLNSRDPSKVCHTDRGLLLLLAGCCSHVCAHKTRSVCAPVASSLVSVFRFYKSSCMCVDIAVSACQLYLPPTIGSTNARKP